MPAGSTSTSERQWAAMAHVGALVLALLTSWFAGFAGIKANEGVLYRYPRTLRLIK